MNILDTLRGAIMKLLNLRDARALGCDMTPAMVDAVRQWDDLFYLTNQPQHSLKMAATLTSTMATLATSELTLSAGAGARADWMQGEIETNLLPNLFEAVQLAGAALRRSFEVGVILDDWYDMLRTKDDTVQLIKRLKKRGYGVFYLSNISWDVLEMLQQRKFWQLFDGGVASCEVKLTKPDLRIYHALLAKYGLSAAESIFIDDNTANASAAFDADITGIHFKNVRTLQRALLSYGVESEKKLSRQKQAATVAAE